MTSEVKVEPTQKPPEKRRPAGMGVGVGVLALVAVPAASAAFAALICFTGCFMGCTDPSPMAGVLYAGVALILLTVPVIAGLATARVLAGRRWQIVVATGTIIAGFVLAALFLVTSS
jgi:hypothetical protein